MPSTAVLKSTTAALASYADKLYSIRNQRLALQKKVEAFQAEETRLKDHLIATLPKNDSTGIAGKTCRISLLVKDVSQADDWDKIHAYVRKTGNWELLQRRLNNRAAMEILEDGKKIPGVSIFTKVDLSINKL